MDEQMQMDESASNLIQQEDVPLTIDEAMTAADESAPAIGINESIFYTANGEEEVEPNLEKEEAAADEPRQDGAVPQQLEEEQEEQNEAVQQQEEARQQDDIEPASEINNAQEKMGKEDDEVASDRQKEVKIESVVQVQIQEKVENAVEITKVEDGGSRKRQREARTLEQQYSEEPRTKKAALEQLKSMKFANARDPFKDNPPRDRLMMGGRSRERTPPPRKSSGEESRRRGRDEPPTGRNRRSRSKGRRPREPEQSTAMTNLVESRHQRSTMYFLQNEQHRAAMVKPQHHRGGAPAATRPLRERIDAMLERPDQEVLTLPPADLKAFILRGAELYKEHEHFLTRRRVQMIELDVAIAKEREEIERISQQLPPQVRPPLIEDMLASRSRRDQPVDTALVQQQQFMAAQKGTAPPPNFAVPPPSMAMGSEFRPAGMPMPPHLAQQFARAPPPSAPAAAFPLPPPPVSSSASAHSHFSQTPSLLFSKPPPTSSASGPALSTGSPKESGFVPPPNTSLPPPMLPLMASSSAEHKMAQNSAPPAAPMPSNFSMPPPQVAGGMAPVQQERTTPSIPSLLSKPPPNILVSSASSSSSSFSTPGFVVVSSSQSAPSFTPIRPNLSVPPPALPSELLAAKQKEAAANAAFVQHQQVQQLTAGAAMANMHPSRTPPSGMMLAMSPSVATSISSSTSSNASPSKPPPRPLMSINVGLHPPAQPPHRQQSPSRMLRQPGGHGDGSAEMTKASEGGGGGLRERGGRGRRHSPRMARGRGRGGGSQRMGTGMDGARRKRFSSSPSAQVAQPKPVGSGEAEPVEEGPEAQEKEKLEGEREEEAPARTPSPGVQEEEREDSQQEQQADADSSTNLLPAEPEEEEEMDEEQEGQKVQQMNEAESTCVLPTSQQSPSEEEPIAVQVQAADTTHCSEENINSNNPEEEEMLPVSP